MPTRPTSDSLTARGSQCPPPLSGSISPLSRFLDPSRSCRLTAGGRRAPATRRQARRREPATVRPVPKAQQQPSRGDRQIKKSPRWLDEQNRRIANSQFLISSTIDNAAPVRSLSPTGSHGGAAPARQRPKPNGTSDSSRAARLKPVKPPARPRAHSSTTPISQSLGASKSKAAGLSYLIPPRHFVRNPRRIKRAPFASVSPGLGAGLSLQRVGGQSWRREKLGRGSPPGGGGGGLSPAGPELS
ncbi:hypothetical protein PAHAL_5G418000 [Panicum hallii]|uniref:Uncharacterized protein n=1 Tax=Panicum hallii TaxID=206008 RepID=A0A2S3HWI0_9POAL|nr:uncharacterized protein LOC112895290 [Panicum hallii]PAN31473.2 hypothetical protein PAHAL_5G418000 [Panicum hallii]